MVLFTSANSHAVPAALLTVSRATQVGFRKTYWGWGTLTLPALNKKLKIPKLFKPEGTNLRQPSQHKDTGLRTGDVIHDTGVVVENTTLVLIHRFKSGP